MPKVIDIMTGEALEVLPFDKGQAENILAHLMTYKKLPESAMSFGEHVIMRDLIKFIENNSGANVIEVLERNSA